MENDMMTLFLLPCDRDYWLSMNYLVAVVLLHLFSLALASCKYSQLQATTILVADGEICSSGQICYVDNQCAILNRFTTDTSVFVDVTAIGDLKNYPLKSIQIYANNSPIFDMSQMSLSNGLKDLWIDSVRNFDFKSLPKDKFRNVNTLSVRGCGLKLYRSEDIPESVTTLDIEFNALSAIPNPPATLKEIDFSANLNITQLVGLNFTSLEYVSSCDNTGLSTIAYVSFGNKIDHFCCRRCDIKNFTLNEESYKNLNTNLDIISCPPKAERGKNLRCAVVDMGKSIVNKTACTNIGGNVNLLWSSNKWEVCVVPGNNPTLVPTQLTDLPTTKPIIIEAANHTATIVGVVVGVVVVLSGIGLFAWCRQRNDKNYPQKNQTQRTKTQPLLEEADANEAGFDLAPLRLLRLELDDLVADKQLSSGGYGEVWHGTYGRREVAIKRIRDKTARHVQKFAKEILLLSRIDCPYIVQLVGASWERPLDLECVVEYMDMGDLYSYLAKTTPQTFAWEQKLISIESVVRGLMYLHTFVPPVIHRDLKSRNILLDSTKGTKLTDFGESREIEDDTLTNGIGTPKWMAPEVMKHGRYSVAADVYSLGVVLTEYSTHRSPYSDKINPATKKPYTQQYLSAMILKGKIQPTIDTTNTPLWLQELTVRCLSLNPDDRPSILEIQRIIHSTVQVI